MKLNTKNIEEIEQTFRKNLKIQDYSPKRTIQGVQFINLKNITSEDGYFLELARFGEKSEILNLPEFETKQLSYSVINNGGIKAWHVHLKQDDIWFVPSENRLLIGLSDLRKKSPTKGVTMRIILGGNETKLLYIPRGVAHGCANISTNPVTVIYLTNSYFDAAKPDEYRLSWDFFGKDFWQIKKG